MVISSFKNKNANQAFQLFFFYVEAQYSPQSCPKDRDFLAQPCSFSSEPQDGDMLTLRVRTAQQRCNYDHKVEQTQDFLWL